VPEDTDRTTANGQQPDPSLGELVRDATEQLSLLLRSEIELARLELTTSVRRAGMGGVFFAGAGVVLLMALPFLFVALAEGLVAVGLWRWSAYLIVFGIFVLLAAVLGLLGWRSVRKVRKPERTITTVRQAAVALRRSGPA
jgi:MFS family permease